MKAGGRIQECLSFDEMLNMWIFFLPIIISWMYKWIWLFLLLFSTPCYSSLRRLRGRTACRHVMTPPWRRCWTWSVPPPGGEPAKPPCSCCSDRPDWWEQSITTSVTHTDEVQTYSRRLSGSLAVHWALTALYRIRPRCIDAYNHKSIFFSIISSIALCMDE